MADVLSMDVDGLAKLMEPFPPEAINKLPRGVAQSGNKTECRECGGFHRRAAIHLDYVGHAALTERLLQVDPTWTWTPMALEHDGLPRIIERNGQAELWIHLTVCGMTRPGVGTAAQGKEEVSKELIGDALRNAAMRFGCALDLWKKEGPASQDSSNGISEEEIARLHGNQVKVDLVGILGSKEAASEFWDNHSHMHPDAILSLAELDPTDPGSSQQEVKEPEEDSLLGMSDY